MHVKTWYVTLLSKVWYFDGPLWTITDFPLCHMMRYLVGLQSRLNITHPLGNDHRCPTSAIPQLQVTPMEKESTHWKNRLGAILWIFRIVLTTFQSYGRYAPWLTAGTVPPSPASPSWGCNSLSPLPCDPVPISCPPCPLLPSCTALPHLLLQISLPSPSLATSIWCSVLAFQGLIYKPASLCPFGSPWLHFTASIPLFLVPCLRPVVYYYLPIQKLISLKPLPLPSCVQHEARCSGSAW